MTGTLRPTAVTSDESRHDHHKTRYVFLFVSLSCLESKHQILPNGSILLDIALFFLLFDEGLLFHALLQAFSLSLNRTVHEILAYTMYRYPSMDGCQAWL